MRPVVVFPDVEMWGTGFLRAALAGREEPYVGDVYVSNTRPSGEAWTKTHPADPYPEQMITLRRDGGPRLDLVREAPRLGVNVWAGSERDVTDLARLAAALLWSAPDGNPVCRVQQLSGPTPIADDAGPRRFMTFELITRGAQQ